MPQPITRDLHSKSRLNTPNQANSAGSLYTQKLGGQNLCLLTSILIILAAIISSSCSGGEESKSSSAEITELTVTINSADYSISFDANKAFTVLIPAIETIPGKITVKSAVISEKASGLQANDELVVTNNQVNITITAEDGTNINYTLFLNLRPLEVTATEIPKRAATDLRDSYVLFSIKANKNISDYHLAVKERNEAAPTTTEMTEGALKRHLSTNSINVLIAQRLNAPMISYARDSNPDKTLGPGMTRIPTSGLILDSAKDQADTWVAASGANAWVAESVLKPSAQYTLYGMESNGTTVKELLDFSTDATAVTSDYPAAAAITMVDTTLAGADYDITLHADEYYIFPIQTQFNHPTSAGSFEFLTLRNNQLEFLPILVPDGTMFSGTPPSYLLFLVKNIAGASGSEMFQKGSYLLLITSSQTSDFFWENLKIRITAETTYDTPIFQKLVIQR